MDTGMWIAVVAAVLAAVAVPLAIPGLLRDARRRQAQGGGGSLSGVGAGFDAVWRPSADEAHGQWQAQVELPAPAPSPGDKGRVQDGRIVIDLGDRS